MEIKIEKTIERINNAMDSDRGFNAIEIMQLSQAVLSLTHAAASLAGIEKNK